MQHVGLYNNSSRLEDGIRLSLWTLLTTCIPVCVRSTWITAASLSTCFPPPSFCFLFLFFLLPKPTMSLIYSVIAHQAVILAEHSNSSGNYGQGKVHSNSVQEVQATECSHSLSFSLSSHPSHSRKDTSKQLKVDLCLWKVTVTESRNSIRYSQLRWFTFAATCSTTFARMVSRTCAWQTIHLVVVSHSPFFKMSKKSFYQPTARIEF